MERLLHMRLRKIFLLLFLTTTLTGCIVRSKAVIRDNHVISDVIVSRIDDPDKKKHPSYDELSQYVKTSAFAWQELDTEINGWKPSTAMPATTLKNKNGR